MSKKAPAASKKESKAPIQEDSKTPLGVSPAALARRIISKKVIWCPKDESERDPECDPDNPRPISFKDILKAAHEIRKVVPPTLLMKSASSARLKINLYYKIEIFHDTGSFHDRTAINVIRNLTAEQKDNGLVTASMGNFGTSLAYYGRKAGVRVMVVFPEDTDRTVIARCKDRGGRTMLHGQDFGEAKRHAFTLRDSAGYMYINGYDNPNAIIGSGSIGVEILEQLPETDVILVPIGGGGLIAGVAEYVKHVKPEVQIYGVEPSKGCCFFKAMQNNNIYATIATPPCVANKLLIPLAGCNAFYNAKGLISKMVLVDDDWINRAILELAEMESLTVEGSGATALSALLAEPTVLPELNGKTVVCILTSGNMDNYTVFPRCLQRAKAIAGRLIQFKVKIPSQGSDVQKDIFKVIESTGCSVFDSYIGPAWLTSNQVYNAWLHLQVTCNDLEQACILKRVMTKMFPDICEFFEEPFSPMPICACYPKKRFQT